LGHDQSDANGVRCDRPSCWTRRENDPDRLLAPPTAPLEMVVPAAPQVSGGDTRLLTAHIRNLHASPGTAAAGAEERGEHHPDDSHRREVSWLAVAPVAQSPTIRTAA
jgi:hypothetical protein